MSEMKDTNAVGNSEPMDQSGDNSMPSAQQQEQVIKKKFGGLIPKKPPLISKDHERAYFDSADWALGKVLSCHGFSSVFVCSSNRVSNSNALFFGFFALQSGQQGVSKPKGPLEALRPKLQPTRQYQQRSRSSIYTASENEGRLLMVPHDCFSSNDLPINSMYTLRMTSPNKLTCRWRWRWLRGHEHQLISSVEPALVMGS
ncbi:unnamed protein product [Alopecurus aequalis]